MTRLKKGSATAMMILALGLIPALPAAAQTVQSAPATQSCTVEVDPTHKTGNESPDASMAFIVVQKPGGGSENVIVTWKKDPQVKEESATNGVGVYKTEYEIETARRKGAETR